MSLPASECSSNCEGSYRIIGCAMPIRNAGRYTIVILATRTERNGTHIVPTYSRCDRQRETIGAVDGAAQPSEEKIEAQGAEDGDTWIDAELAELELVYPPPSPEQGR